MTKFAREPILAISQPRRPSAASEAAQAGLAINLLSCSHFGTKYTKFKFWFIFGQNGPIFDHFDPKWLILEGP